MPQQLAFGGVAEAALVAQLVDLADIVQHHAGQQQVEIDEFVMAGGQFRQRRATKDVLDQTAPKSMMNLLAAGAMR